MNENMRKWANFIEKHFKSAIKKGDINYGWYDYTISLRKNIEPLIMNNKTKYIRNLRYFVTNIKECIEHDNERKELIEQAKQEKKQRNYNKYLERKRNLINTIDKLL